MTEEHYQTQIELLKKIVDKLDRGFDGMRSEMKSGFEAMRTESQSASKAQELSMELGLSRISERIRFSSYDSQHGGGLAVAPQYPRGVSIVGPELDGSHRGIRKEDI